jgi:5-methyltetrahydropteroyltriglutamate--homocysteine methyltransferase
LDQINRYVQAIAEAMRLEYRTIHEAGFLLQIDCPDLAMGRHIQFPGADLHTFLRHAGMCIEALSWATEGIPPDAMRMHICWGNYEGPHHRDVPLAEIVRLVLGAPPAGISFEASNPRHEHEWKVWQDVALPDDKVLLPGVVDSKTNFIEHPELVADRLTRLAGLVGKERVIASTDCGFATFAGIATVDPDIVWAKLASLADGARLASRALWQGAGARAETAPAHAPH